MSKLIPEGRGAVGQVRKLVPGKRVCICKGLESVRNWHLWELKEVLHGCGVCMNDRVVRCEGQSGQGPMSRVGGWV